MDGLADSSEEIAKLIPITRGGVSLGSLRSVDMQDADDPRTAERLASWHLAAFGAVAGSLLFTPEEARRWLIDRILRSANRRLFWVRDLRGRAVGHLGLTGKRIGDRLPAEPVPGLFAAAEDTLACWVTTSGSCTC